MSELNCKYCGLIVYIEHGLEQDYDQDDLYHHTCHIEYLEAELTTRTPDARITGLENSLALSDAMVKAQNGQIKELEEQKRLHAGDCSSLANEAEQYKEERDGLQAELAWNQWVSVADRLPPTKLTCETYFLTDGINAWVDAWATDGNGGFVWLNGHRFTHWKPITLPNTKEGA